MNLMRTLWKCIRGICICFVLFSATAALAQLVVTVSQPRITGSKTVVPLTLENGLAKKIESARAVVFLLDQQGKMIAQQTRWVIGETQDKPGLDSGATNSFYFVISSAKPLATTNLTAKVSFSRVVLEGGQIADSNKDVEIHNHIQ
jgi:hypothetical protein